MNSHPSIENHIHTIVSSEENVNINFNSLAMSVFNHQIKHNSSYQNYCQHLSFDVKHWQDIPALPTDVFKLHDLPIISFPPDKIRHTFTTSGTTLDVKGQHHFPSLTLYEQSILTAWDQLDLPQLKSQQIISLTPTPQQAPQSSLSHMMGTLEKKQFSHFPTAIWAIDDDSHLDVQAILQACERKQPVALLGTALAFLHLFEQIDHPLRLAAGSWAMETGGYKGSHRQLEKAELYSLFQDKLGLKPNSIINEYSMTELSSQFYTRGLGNPHIGPPWTRIRVIDPRTETDALPGEPGHLVIYDLANLHSVMAIRTQDLAISNGDNSFTLLGRDPSALPRGCSRAADDTLRQ